MTDRKKREIYALASMNFEEKLKFRDMAEKRGFFHAGRGNIAAYIRHLIYEDINHYERENKMEFKNKEVKLS